MALSAVLGLKGILACCAIGALKRGALATGVVLGGAGATLTAVAVLGAACAMRRGCARVEKAAPPAPAAPA